MTGDFVSQHFRDADGKSPLLTERITLIALNTNHLKLRVRHHPLSCPNGVIRAEMFHCPLCAHRLNATSSVKELACIELHIACKKVTELKKY